MARRDHGAGNLGRPLAGYPGFISRGFEVVGIPDSGQYLIGRELGHLRVATTDDLEAVIRRTSANIAVLSVPASAAP
ncbi:hypothetical protein [Paenarthrobacter sp. NPDC058040]|uniref:hypothetical protein n=1 Tax=unclassified Paenarthrobacter TaxID=2634190 RepID=UPI0036DB3BBE